MLSAPDESTATKLEHSILEKQDLCRRYATEKVHLAVQARQLLESSISTLENHLEQVLVPSIQVILKEKKLFNYSLHEIHRSTYEHTYGCC